MAINISPNMNLPVPQVGNEAGPQYATDVNGCMTLIDQHTHAPGYGVPINPSGIDINADLLMNNNNLTLTRSIRFSSQPSPIANPADLGCLYESGVDLYFNDGLGNQIQITDNGGIAGTPGSISNLTPPASASYVSADSTFVWQSAANTAANMDGGSVLIREVAANANAITLSSPTSLAADYTLTLPGALPAATNFLTLSAGGAIAAVTNVDNTTIEISSNNLRVKQSGIGFNELAPNTIINRAYAELTAFSSTTARIPTDDTIPQQSEGTQIMTCSITPKLASSILRVTFQGSFGNDESAALVLAMFRDSAADAVTAALTDMPDADSMIQAGLSVELAASSTAATTFKIRVGAVSGTLQINGVTTTRRLGGVMRATVIIEEIKQ